jgi:ribosomal protein S18 acetylase RimI-like enzyme
MEIVSAKIDDIPAIQHIASITWPVAYIDILTPRQTEYMLNMMYSHQTLLKQVTEEGHLFYLLKDDSKKIGFAGISPYSYTSSAIPANANIWKLHKLYLLPEAQGTGAGKKLMDHCLTEIKTHGGNYLVLNVNRENKAFQFYLKNGFEVLETADFDIGAGFFMKDHVLGKRL